MYNFVYLYRRAEGRRLDRFPPGKIILLSSFYLFSTFQAVLMYAGVLSLIVKGLAHPRVGGFFRVLDVAYESGRIGELWRVDWRIDQVPLLPVFPPKFQKFSTIPFG